MRTDIIRLSVKPEFRDDLTASDGLSLRESLLTIGVDIPAADAADAWSAYSDSQCASWMMEEDDPFWTLHHILPYCDIEPETGAGLLAAIPTENRDLYGVLKAFFVLRNRS